MEVAEILGYDVAVMVMDDTQKTHIGHPSLSLHIVFARSSWRSVQCIIGSLGVQPFSNLC